MVQEMLFKDKTRDGVHANHSHIQKKETVQMYTVWSDIMASGKTPFCRISLLDRNQFFGFYQKFVDILSIIWCNFLKCNDRKTGKK